MQYTWNIVFSGHGGSTYTESNNNKIVTWNGEPCIADLTLHEFKYVLEFFETQIKTHIFHYSSCGAGGNHIDVVFENGNSKNYNYAIICDCLTDCAAYCKWGNVLPSEKKKALTSDDLYYDSINKSWNLITKSPYEWNKFFNSIHKIDFSQEYQAIESIEYLPKILSYITYPVIANISLLRRPGINNFYPLFSSDTIKIDDHFIIQTKENKKRQEDSLLTENDNIVIKGSRVLLLESDYIDFTLKIDTLERFRIISTKAGNALHYIKKLDSAHHLDLTRAFCQAEYQTYNKTFLIDECIMPIANNSLIFKNLEVPENNIILKNIIITQQSNFFNRFIRLFFTINDKAIMVVTNKADELHESTILQEMIPLTPEAKCKYEEHYVFLKNSFNIQ